MEFSFNAVCKVDTIAGNPKPDFEKIILGLGGNLVQVRDLGGCASALLAGEPRGLAVFHVGARFRRREEFAALELLKGALDFRAD